MNTIAEMLNAADADQDVATDALEPMIADWWLHRKKAAREGFTHTEIIARLMNAGADISRRFYTKRKTVLMFYFLSPEIIQVLLSHGAAAIINELDTEDVNCLGHCYKLDMMTMMIEAGAKPSGGITTHLQSCTVEFHLLSVLLASTTYEECVAQDTPKRQFVRKFSEFKTMIDDRRPESESDSDQSVESGADINHPMIRFAHGTWSNPINDETAEHVRNLFRSHGWPW